MSAENDVAGEAPTGVSGIGSGWRQIWRAPVKRYSSIGTRLIAVVLATALLAFGMIGGLTIFRLDLGQKEQADALGKWSERQLADRLDGEAQLARARIEVLGAETAQRLRQVAQRSDVTKAVASRNDVTIRELLFSVARTLGFDSLIAFDGDGRAIGTNTALDLLAVHMAIQQSELASDLKYVLQNNSRSRPHGFEGTREIRTRLLEALRWPLRLTIGHVAVEPVFDDFGEQIGALVAIRTLGRTEGTLENFSSLSNAGVVILRDNMIVSSAGPQGVNFPRIVFEDHKLTRSEDGAHVARCVDYEVAMKVCTFTDASVITATRDQMLRIGAEQTRSLMGQFLISAAGTLLVLVIALLISVRHATRGLATLASAAKAVANGHMDVPFNAQGVGEVYSLGLAFERMLANLRASMTRIRQLAFYDTVTELSNREKIRLDAAEIIEKSGRGAFFFLDLDGFKSINDTFGHKTGDLLLKKVAERLIEFFSNETAGDTKMFTIARVGGDEFAAILPDVESEEIVGNIAKRLIDMLRYPFDIGASHMSIGASVGITLYPSAGRTYEELLINSDLAMYEAKSRGRNTYALFTHEIGENAKQRITLEQDLKHGIRANQLSVWYQPKVSCKNGQICGVEALVRWNHPTLGDIAPDRFIEIAEETGLISDIGRFVLERSLVDMGSLIAAGSDVKVAVNVSAVELEDPRFASRVIELLEQTGFPPSKLELEITESVAMRDPKAVFLRVAALRKLGVRFAIDDFGVGYSNLATLARIPVDTVKLDRSLVIDVSRDTEKQSIVRIVLSLAKEFGFETVAEGVENAADLSFVANEGATMAQGFYFSPARPFEEFAALLQPHRLVALGKEGRERSKVSRIAVGGY